MTALKALAAQTLAWLAVIALLTGGALPHATPLALALIQGGLAGGIGLGLRADRWWLPIHLLFSPALIITSQLNLAPAWFLAGFVLLALIYWSSFKTQVPLYLSNQATAQALLQLIPESGASFIDLGCGTGSLLRHLARARPGCRFAGVETAPLPWLLARIACRGLSNCTIRRGDFWQDSLAQHNLVYAFLSPVPMADLERKAANEMRPGSLLISNSFPLPETAPSQTIEVPDRRQTRLYCYRH